MPVRWGNFLLPHEAHSPRKALFEETLIVSRPTAAHDLRKPVDHPERLLRFAEVQLVTGCTKNLVYRLMRLGEFPAAIPLAAQARSVAWRESEIRAWVALRIEQARSPDAPSRRHLAGPGRGKRKNQAEPNARKRESERRADAAA